VPGKVLMKIFLPATQIEVREGEMVIRRDAPVAQQPFAIADARGTRGFAGEI
jgi:hypothetical protein